MSRILPIIACLVLCCGCVWAAEGVRIVANPDGYTVQTAIYAAKVDTAGTLTSLIIGGTEFISAPVNILRSGKESTAPGLYACYMGNWWRPYKAPGMTALHDNTLHAEGNQWTLDYSFLPDAIDLTYSGVPEGERSFRAGYPPAELVISLSHDLARACDPANQGDLGWPIARAMEPGTYSVMDTHGAGFTAENVCRIDAFNSAGYFPEAPHRLDLLVFNTYEQTPKPITHRLQLFNKPDLAHSLTLEITSPNPDHTFPGVTDVVFPVKITALYGQSLKGALAFKGAPYVWKKPEVTASVPVELTPEKPSQTLLLPIRPPKPGHYTGQVYLTDGNGALYSKRIGFLFQPEGIQPAQPPQDFDKFWDDTMAELAKVPLDLTMEPQPDKETPAGICYKVKYRSWAGQWAWAWLYVPKKEGKVPATVYCPPVSVWQPGQAHAAGGDLSICVAVHGGDVSDFPAKPPQGFDYMNSGITSRETYALRYSYCCLARCFDIIKNYEKCDGTIKVQGGSQGAGLSLVLAGLRPASSVRGAAIALCRIDWTILGFAEWGPRCPPGEEKEKIAEVVRYFDPANFAHRIHSPLRLATGLFDFCAPAEGIFTAINALPNDTKCEVFIDPYGGHFTLDVKRFNSNEPGVDIPRWQGTDEENKLAR
ncbi:MAG TPA: acetylxylan esterase [Armatimonadota bacterium]|jgi:cephalosporin-C deacetylase